MGELEVTGPPGAQSASAGGYRDPHETSITLLVLGAVIIALMLAQIMLPGFQGVFGWLVTSPSGIGLTAALTIAFSFLWLTFRTRAAERGMRYRRGFGIGAVIAAIMWIPPFVGALFIAGPFALLGPVLLFAGIGLSNYFLVGWAVAIGTLGIFEGSFGITNRLPASLWVSWGHAAIYLGLGVLTVGAGIVARTRENRQFQPAAPR